MTNPDLPGDDDLVALERAVQRAFETADDSGLRVLGYGEISLVVGWPTDAPRWAVKRLPAFPDRASADRYRAVVEEYVATLTASGVDVVPTAIVEMPGRGRGGGPTLAHVQPVLDADSLGPAVLQRGGSEAERLLDQVVGAVRAVTDAGPKVGLDAQISNWSWGPSGASYLDVSTPLLFDDGAPALDVRLYLASFPWLLREPVARFVAPGLLDRYSDPRSVTCDLAANLHKERLTEWIEPVLDRANPWLRRPLSAEEVADDYRSDARLWAAMLALRRADRWWQRTIRRRTYPFLLPGPIER